MHSNPKDFTVIQRIAIYKSLTGFTLERWQDFFDKCKKADKDFHETKTDYEWIYQRVKSAELAKISEKKLLKVLKPRDDSKV